MSLLVYLKPLFAPIVWMFHGFLRRMGYKHGAEISTGDDNEVAGNVSRERKNSATETENEEFGQECTVREASEPPKKKARVKGIYFMGNDRGCLEETRGILQGSEDCISVGPQLHEAVSSQDVDMLRLQLSHDSRVLERYALQLHYYVPSLHTMFEKNDTRMVDMMVDTLLPHVTQEHGPEVEELLHTAIRYGCRRSLLENMDRLWLRTYSKDDSKDDALFDRLIAFYRSHLGEEHVLGLAHAQLLYCAVHIGIARHVRLLLSRVAAPPPLELEMLRIAQKHGQEITSILSDSITAAATGNPHAPSRDDVRRYATWYDDIAFTSSTITSQNMAAEFIAQAHTQTLCNFQRMLRIIDFMVDKPETEQVFSAVRGFMGTLSEEVAKQEPMLRFRPVLVGSANEGTRCYFPDEFDFLLVFEELEELFDVSYNTRDYVGVMTAKPTNDPMRRAFLERIAQHAASVPTSADRDVGMSSDLANDVLHDMLRSAVEHAMKTASACLCGTTGLVIEQTGFFIDKNKYPCIFLTWRGVTYNDMKIKIDLVPSFRLHTQVDVPEHHHMPVQRPFYVTAPGIDFLRIGFSELENHIMREIPAGVRGGYKVAKAMRNVAFIAPALPRIVQHMGVVFDVEDFVTSYMLKTCVFYITRTVRKDAALASRSRVYWATRIYGQLLAFVTDGFIPHFFFFPLTRAVLFSCSAKHRKSYARLTPTTPSAATGAGYFCCRKRTAMMALIERILHVLKLYET